jgi:putative ABC transport system permease protein
MLEDLRFALRRLRRSPGFTAVAILMLALAIGANTAIFSIADAVLFRPLPYAEPDRLFTIRMAGPDGALVSYLAYEYVAAVHEHHQGLAGLGIRGSASAMTHVNSPDDAEWLPTVVVSPEYLRVLGVELALGRGFGDADAPGDVAVITYDTWRHRFGADPQIVGRSEQLGVRSRIVIGVLPRGFVFPTAMRRMSMAPSNQPAFLTVAPLPPGGDPQARGPFSGGIAVEPIVRLAPGVSRDQAQAELEAIASGVTPLKRPAGKLVLQDLRSLLFPVGHRIMLLLVAAAGLVLLIGCANLATLLLVRSRRGAREIGIRLALGAGAGRIVRPLFVEAVVIGLAAAAVALVVTHLTFDALVRHVPPEAYGAALVGPDLRVGILAFALGLGGGVLFAVVPAWRLTHVDPRLLLQRLPIAGRHGRSPDRPMLAVQVALAVIVAAAAAAAGKALGVALAVPLGFEPERVAVLSMTVQSKDALARRSTFLEAIARLAARPDVVAAGAASAPPMGTSSFPGGIESPDGRPIGFEHVLPGFFEAAGVPLARGRLPAPGDVNRADVAVLSESAARALFPSADPLGQAVVDPQGTPLRVVGIVGDVRQSLEWDAPPAAYGVDASVYMDVLVKVRARRPGTLDALRREIGGLTPGEPVTAIWWSDRIEALTPYRQPRFQALVLGGFGLIALGLTALGIFAIVASLVASRTRELGVRMALGATPRSLVRLVVRQAFTPVVAGIALGVIGVYWVRRVAEAYLAGLDTRDPVMVIIAVVTVLLAALLAAWVPARQASRVDPAVVLRAE